MFRRRRKQDDSEESYDAQLEAELDLEEAGETDEQPPAPAVREGGPHDATAPDDGVPRVDLGGMQVPVLEGLELRVEVDDAGTVVAATLVDEHSMMQLGVFAAPKTTGIWTEVRDEIAESIRGGGGQVEEVDGPYGPELRTAVPTDVPGQLAPARFVGVDGPRWFLRALFSGAAGLDLAAAERFDEVLRGVVVIRGTEAMPIRDPLPLRLPDEALAAPDAAEQDEQPSLDPFERGPEITEVR